MGEIRKRTFKYCATCGKEATKICRVERHPIELREWPTYWIRYYRDGRRFEESARSEKYDEAVTLLKLREGEIAKGGTITPKIGRLRFEEAAVDLLTDYQVNGKRSHKNLKSTIIEG